jgi:hypothetical protein
MDNHPDQMEPTFDQLAARVALDVSSVVLAQNMRQSKQSAAINSIIANLKAAHQREVKAESARRLDAALSRVEAAAEVYTPDSYEARFGKGSYQRDAYEMSGWNDLAHQLRATVAETRRSEGL